jgi:putative pyrroloquinoline-quinone-binding quinoprotein
MKTTLKSAGRIAGMFPIMVLAGGVCFAQPAVTLSVAAGPPTTNLYVSGTGFPASTVVPIYFDVTNLAMAVTDGTGSFSGIQIRVPASALPGTNWVTAAVAGITGDAAQTPFNVQADWAQFHFAASHSGRNPYENVLSRKTARDLGVSWSYTTGDAVTSSPAVANGVVYAGSGDGNVYAIICHGRRHRRLAVAIHHRG